MNAGWWVVLAGALLALVAAGLIWRQARGLRGRVDALGRDVSAADAEVRQAIASREGMCLIVEVADPLAVAAVHSRMAGPVSGVAPGLVRRRVYEQLRRELDQQLRERGIDARIDIHRGGD